MKISIKMYSAILYNLFEKNKPLPMAKKTLPDFSGREN